MNRFFDIALRNASRITGKPGRIALLLVKLSAKMKSVNWNTLATDSKDKILLLARLARAFADGSYRSICPKSIMIVIAGLLYFVNPFDLIPDFALAIGLTDDFSVLIWICSTLQKELDRFKRWEHSLLSQ